MRNSTVQHPIFSFQPSRVFCMVMAAWGLIYLCITPPFETPDEPAHFARAYGLTEGQLILETHPRELVLFFQQQLAGHREFYEYIETVLANEPGRISNLAFNTAVYSPIPYLAHALGIKLVSVVCHASPSLLTIALYSARLISLGMFVWVLFAVARLQTPLKWPLLWVSSTPMLVAQAAAVNIDVVLFAASMLMLSLSLKGTETWRDVGTHVLAGLVLILSKPVYAPIFLIPFTSLLLGNATDKVRKAVVLCTGFGITVLIFLYWNHIVKANGIMDHYLLKAAVIAKCGTPNPAGQLAGIIGDPLGFVRVILNTAHQYGWEVFHQFVGVLSWLNTPLPAWTAMVWPVFALVSTCLGSRRNDTFRFNPHLFGGACIVAALICGILVMVSAYLIWMGVGAKVVLLQGRYFHVNAALFLLGLSLCLPRQNTWSQQNILKWGLVFSACLINGAGIYTLWEKFWL